MNWQNVSLKVKIFKLQLKRQAKQSAKSIFKRPVFDYLLWLCLKGGRQHVGEEFQSHRKQKLHEGDDDEHQEGKKSEDVGTCSEELGRKMWKNMN